ncbi:MAG: type IV toxin-antitoxin system AbiEi family antitoxin domain-containing protein [Bacillota bacterium]|nr:type IV toxin-antitoxin system AbiEi family antitoxin domain-containing protein [Bacillota bacterium]
MIIDNIDKEMGEKTYISTRELINLGISKASISRLVSKGDLIRVERGLYCRQDIIHDIMFILHHKYKQGVFSHESALYIHGLTDRNPTFHVMSVPRNYRVTKSKKYNIEFKYVDKSMLNLGLKMYLSNMGNMIPVYDIERTICDIIKSDTKMDSYEVNSAIRKYASKKKFSKLMLYAKKLGIERKVRKKLEVLL